MISIVISTRNEELVEELKSSIAHTIGCDFEVVIVENDNQYSINEAYNIGAKRSKSNYILFLHDDVKFVTKNWGNLLKNHLNEPNSGVIGVAGSTYLPLSPSNWWVKNPNLRSMNIIQQYKHIDRNTRHLQLNHTSKRQCILLDGVFLACRKEVWQEFPFNEKLEGFHFYDYYFCLGALKKYSNYFIPDILIEHFSEGKTDPSYYRQSIEANKMNFNLLPMYSEGHAYDFASEKSALISILKNSTFLSKWKWLNLYRYLSKNYIKKGFGLILIVSTFSLIINRILQFERSKSK